MTATAERPPTKKSYSSRRKLIEAVSIIAMSTFVIFVLSSIALLIYTNGSREPTVHTIDIPPGSHALIEQGQNPLDIPPTWTFYADDTLVLDNQDSFPHTLGNWVVAPKTIQSFELQPAYGGVFVCTLHPSGSITLDIQPRDYDFRLVAIPTFGFGFAVGIIIVIGLNVVRALDHDENELLYEGFQGRTVDRSADEDG
jgi:hypothetical protein